MGFQEKITHSNSKQCHILTPKFRSPVRLKFQHCSQVSNSSKIYTEISQNSSTKGMKSQCLHNTPHCTGQSLVGPYSSCLRTSCNFHFKCFVARHEHTSVSNQCKDWTYNCQKQIVWFQQKSMGFAHIVPAVV